VAANGGNWTPKDVSSYPANIQVFQGDPRIESAFPDGMSNTVAFAEHYAVCGGTRFSTLLGPNMSDVTRRPAFADRGASLQSGPAFIPPANDVIPVVSGFPPTAAASTPGRTFQTRPRLEDCDPTVPQTPHAGGMLVALADGSVRTIRSEVAEHVFWAAVTPAGGEVAPLD